MTLLEASDDLGGKSRRIEVGGQRMDTGPSLVTFPGVWEELLRRWDGLGDGRESAREVTGLKLRRLGEVGRYYYRGKVCSLPVEEGHPWRAAWERFEDIHGGLGPEVTSLLTADPLDRGTLPALLKLLRVYGAKLTTRGYLDALRWLPEGLREVIAIHTLNAGVGPDRTPALYASMPAIMARDGVWVPEGGVYEIPRALENLARAAGVEIHTGEPVTAIRQGRVLTEGAEYPADAVVSGLDAGVLEEKLAPHRHKARPGKLSCSGVAIYAALREELPESVATHGVVLPGDPRVLYRSLEAREEPEETMAFVNYYRPGEVYPNDGGTLALLLTAPPNGRAYGLESPFVERELGRLGREIGLSRPIEEYLGEHEILHPRYFEGRGAPGGALYGEVRPFWRSGPFHSPRYNDRRRPWLWRVGASVHPGGGIPAVLGGAMISTTRLLRSLGG
ncbi:phytoene desaturase family protein [Rubrobacter marinus]|uniref:phytoene desaturase family protein n=1 Tax=Rubrobacter marinus TaxID=2653852 RepID=UPI00389A1405